MKKILAIISAMVIAMSSLAGCGSKEASQSQSSKEESNQNTASGAPANKLEKIKSSGKLIVGTSPDFVPMEFEDISSGKKEYVGADIELAKYIAEKLGVELEIKAMEFMAIQQAVMSDVVDLGISGFAKRPDREEAMYLSDFYNMSGKDGQGLIVPAEKASQYTTAESFAGKKIAAQNASLQQSLASENLPEDIELKPVATTTDGILMLTSGKVDAMAVSLDTCKNLIEANPQIAIAEYKFPYVSEGNVIALKKGEDALLEEVNKILAEVNESGIFKTWKDDANALAKKLNIKTE